MSNTVTFDGKTFDATEGWQRMQKRPCESWPQIGQRECLSFLLKGAELQIHFWATSVEDFPPAEFVIHPWGISGNGAGAFDYCEVKWKGKSYKLELPYLSAMLVRGYLEPLPGVEGPVMFKLSERGLNEASRGKK